MDDKINAKEDWATLRTPQPKRKSMGTLPPLTMKLQKEKNEIIKEIERTDDEYLKKKLEID